MNEEKIYKFIIKAKRKAFYNDSNCYGIFNGMVLPESESYDNMIKNTKDNEFLSYLDDNVTIVGDMPELQMEKEYVVEAVKVEHKKFGMQYQVNMIYEKTLSTSDEQMSFLSVILSENQYKRIYEMYCGEENILEKIKSNEIDITSIAGLGKATRDKIIEKIKENEKYQKAIVELTSKFGVPFSAVKKMTQAYGSAELFLNKVKENPYILTEIDGYGFKKADEIALKLGVNKNDVKRINSCIEFVLKEEEQNGHVYLQKERLVRRSMEYLNIRSNEIKDFLLEEQQENEHKFRYDKETERVYLLSNKLTEMNIAVKLKMIADRKENDFLDETSENYERNLLKVEKWIKEVEKEQGFLFAKEQKEAIMYSVKYNVVIIDGRAGSGKSSVIKGIVKVLSKVIDDFDYNTCALSGKASQRITEMNLKSATIHRLCGYNPNVGWLANEENPLHYNLVILDEGSMANSNLVEKLVCALNKECKFIITGDVRQLEAIGMGNVLNDLIQSGKVPHVELLTIHRQALDSGTKRCANLVDDGVKFYDVTKKIQKFGVNEDFTLFFHKEKENILKRTLMIANQFYEHNGNINEITFLAPTKNKGLLSTKNLNNELQKIFNSENLLYSPQEKKIERKDFVYLEGDRVMMQGNDYERDIFNGSIGTIKYISTKDKGEIVIDFDDAGERSFEKKEMDKIDLAYAITIHKSQGSTIKNVVICFDFGSYIMLNKQLIYTGMTRASEKLLMVCDEKALAHGIKTDKASNRNTFLKEYVEKLF